ncbi:MAG: hypothetical protein PHO23_03370 [Candidatus Pacebacteria bacterium]|nr:hypothetical protein [Candidatus Paceibacterota bacterium]
MTFGAWTIPTADPPAGNIDPPIKASSEAQTKSGSLTLTGGLVSSGLSLFQNTVNFKSSTNSATFFEILDASNTSLFLADTVNNRVGVHTYSPTVPFEVVGDTGITGNVSVTGNVVSTGNFTSDQFCMGVDCITEWPTGGGSEPYNPPVLFADTVNNASLLGAGYVANPMKMIPYYDSPMAAQNNFIMGYYYEYALAP